MAQVQNENNQLNKNTANAAAPVSNSADWTTQPTRVEDNVMPKGKRPKIGVGLAVAVLILLAIVVAGLMIGKKTQKQPIVQQSPQIPVSSPNPETSPSALPTIKEKTKTEELRTYFSAASSSHFKEEFLQQLPDMAANSYIAFKNSTNNEDKLNSARSFYIILNNPAINRNDPEFINFAADIRADLESKLGGPLF